MTKDELIAALHLCAQNSDTEMAHSEADALLLSYICDADIRTAYNAVEKWYA